MPASPHSSNGPARRARLLRIGAAAVLLILLLVAALQARQFEQADQLRKRVDYSFGTRAQIQRVFSLHQDMETGQRGFVLTGNESFLEPYQRARPRLEPELARLRDRIRGNRELEEYLARLALLSGEKIAFSENALRVRQRGGQMAASGLVAGGTGKALMDDIRATVARMDAIERHHLQQVTAQAGESRRQMQALTFGLEALLLLLLVGAAWTVTRAMAATRAAAEELRDLSARQEAIFDAVTDGIITHDARGTIESLNPAAARMYGYQPGELVGRHIGILFGQPASQERLERFLSRLASDPKGPAGGIREFTAKRSDGCLFTIDAATSPVFLHDGLHFVAVIRDITERKRIEEMKTEFVSTVSHELRTPLTSIAGSLGLLAGGAAGDLPERAARLIKIAHSNSERLVRLINDILDIEKIESGKMNFDIRPVPLRPLVEQAIQANLAYAKDYEVRLTLAGLTEDVAVLGDSDRLMQVLTNLLSNAAKFSPKGGEVMVRIVPGGHSHRVSIEDRGSGIPEEFKERIFGKFAQADASDTREKGGTGLGLSIVREIVTRLGGTVSFESGEGQGTVFHVDLPAAASAGAGKGRRRILICQADSGAAAEIKRLLGDAGFEADIASNSDEVRALAASTTYSAILLDLALPGEEAISLIGRLRADPRYVSVPILIASSDGATGQVSQTLAVVDWLQQPIAPEKLVERVREGIEAGKRPCILHIEDDVDVLRVVASAFDGRADLHSVGDLETAREALRKSRYDLVILDLAFPGGSGLQLLPEMRREDGRPIPVVIFSAQDDDPALARRVEAMLTKSRASLNDLVGTVEALLANPRLPREEKE
jgi:PAS domain S-box-containing protein